MSQDSHETCDVCSESKIQDIVIYCSKCQENICEVCNSEYPESFDCGDSQDWFCRRCVRENPQLLERRKCKNYDICGAEMLSVSMDKIPGQNMCFECWASRGELKKTYSPEECPVCMDEKLLVELSCHNTHKICLECLDKTNESKHVTNCPLCRKSIGNWKLNLK
jgi:hypothetical protein